MPYRPTPKTEARNAAMRARLMAAACRLFSEQGYEATTLQQIVTEARSSIGNCYFYFPNKEAILLAIADDLRQEIARKIDCAIAPLPLGPGLFAVAIYVGMLAALEHAEVAYQNALPYRFDSTRFNTAFHLTPTSYQEGIRRTVEYQQKVRIG